MEIFHEICTSSAATQNQEKCNKSGNWNCFVCLYSVLFITLSKNFVHFLLNQCSIPLQFLSTATSCRVALTRQLPAFYPQFKVSVRDGLDTPIFLPVTAYADALTCPGLKSSNAAEPFKGRKIRSYP